MRIAWKVILVSHLILGFARANWEDLKFALSFIPDHCSTQNVNKQTSFCYSKDGFFAHFTDSTLTPWPRARRFEQMAVDGNGEIILYSEKNVQRASTLECPQFECLEPKKSTMFSVAMSSRGKLASALYTWPSLSMGKFFEKEFDKEFEDHNSLAIGEVSWIKYLAPNFNHQVGSENRTVIYQAQGKICLNIFKTVVACSDKITSKVQATLVRSGLNTPLIYVATDKKELFLLKVIKAGINFKLEISTPYNFDKTPISNIKHISSRVVKIGSTRKLTTKITVATEKEVYTCGVAAVNGCVQDLVSSDEIKEFLGTTSIYPRYTDQDHLEHFHPDSHALMIRTTNDIIFLNYEKPHQKLQLAPDTTSAWINFSDRRLYTSGGSKTVSFYNGHRFGPHFATPTKTFFANTQPYILSSTAPRNRLGQRMQSWHQLNSGRCWIFSIYNILRFYLPDSLVHFCYFQNIVFHDKKGMPPTIDCCKPPATELTDIVFDDVSSDVWVEWKNWCVDKGGTNKDVLYILEEHNWLDQYYEPHEVTPEIIKAYLDMSKPIIGTFNIFKNPTSTTTTWEYDGGHNIVLEGYTRMTQHEENVLPWITSNDSGGWFARDDYRISPFNEAAIDDRHTFTTKGIITLLPIKDIMRKTVPIDTEHKVKASSSLEQRYKEMKISDIDTFIQDHEVITEKLQPGISNVNLPNY